MKQGVDINVGRRWVVAEEVINELAVAQDGHGPMHSTHEGYAVILEELDELWDLIKINPRKLVSEEARARLKKDIRKEAIQVAAMAIRFVIDVCREGE
jgi:hypothetical protein